MSESVEKGFNVKTSQINLGSSIKTIAGCIGIIPSLYISEYFGLKWSLLLQIITIVISIALNFLMFEDWRWLYLSALIQGFFKTIYSINTLTFMKVWINLRWRGTMFAFIGMSTGMGYGIQSAIPRGFI